jgi:hypothetical protein
MESEHIKPLSNLYTNAFSRDCYFYYIVPDDEIEAIAHYFKDANWITYSKLNPSDRLAYRKANCRTGSSSGDASTEAYSDEDETGSTVSAADTSMEEQPVAPMAAPFYSLTVPRSRSSAILQESPEFNLIMHVLVVMLFFKLLNDIMVLNE